jgi:sulfoxide reductase heme-binding subunit YedZ
MSTVVAAGFAALMCFLPVILLGLAICLEGVGPDPGKYVVVHSGLWSLRLLLLTLLLGTWGRYANLAKLLRYRRWLGVSVAAYASLHFFAVLTYITGWSLRVALEELSERPYMVMGFISWLLLLPLAATSNNWSLRSLARRWRVLHRLVYPAAILASGHMLWLQRSDYREAWLYSVTLLLLLFERIVRRRLSVIG